MARDSFDGYIRVSRVAGREGASFISPAVQRDTIKRLAKYHGLELGEVVEGFDVSGGKSIEDRDLGRLVRKVEAGESGGLVVWKLSRFSRNLLDGVTVADRITRANGRLLAEDFDSEQSMGKAILGFLLGWAEEELDARRVGWREAQRRAAERGVFPSRTPVGYLRSEEDALGPQPSTGSCGVVTGALWFPIGSRRRGRGYVVKFGQVAAAKDGQSTRGGEALKPLARAMTSADNLLHSLSPKSHPRRSPGSSPASSIWKIPANAAFDLPQRVGSDQLHLWKLQLLRSS